MTAIARVRLILIALNVGAAFGLIVSFPRLRLNAFTAVVAVFGALLGGELYKMIAPMIGA